VSETALTCCIVAARKAVGDDGTKQEVIETQHGRDYRFVAPVSERGVERKLAAVFSADVKGYSRLMGEDEVGTVRTLTTYRQLMSTIIQQYHGRVVDSPGDNLLAEFASVVDAVQAAVAIQRELKDKNADLPALAGWSSALASTLGRDRGGGAHYGDGVNIAARVESLAEASGICISGPVYDQVKSKLILQYESLGSSQSRTLPSRCGCTASNWNPNLLLPL
jgi:class 3 adenylate cyclase